MAKGTKSDFAIFSCKAGDWSLLMALSTEALTKPMMACATTIWQTIAWAVVDGTPEAAVEGSCQRP